MYAYLRVVMCMYVYECRDLTGKQGRTNEIEKVWPCQFILWCN